MAKYKVIETSSYPGRSPFRTREIGSNLDLCEVQDMFEIQRNLCADDEWFQDHGETLSWTIFETDENGRRSVIHDKWEVHKES